MPDDSALDLVRFGIGQPVRRTEDPRLLTGRGLYSDDESLPCQVHAVMVRSTVAHGLIRKLDLAAAKRAPGVVDIFTGADMAADGLGGFPCVVPLKSRDGSPLIIPHRPALAVDRVRHVGDAVAVVVAATRDQAQDAAELVVLEIEPLPAVTDAVEGAKPGAPQIYPEMPNNVCLDWLLGDPAAVDAAFAKAAHVTRLRLDNNRVVVNAMEPRAALATYDAASDKMTLWTGSQGVFGLRNNIAQSVFKIDPKKLRVVSQDVGGSFGMKGQPYSESVSVLYAARKLMRPVKWRADRTESFLSDHQGRASIVDAALALDKDGNFLAIRITGHGNMGAYLTSMGPAPPTNVLSRNIVSVYKTPAVAVAMKCVMTNTVPTGPYRGAGRPESKYILERLIDQAARETGSDPVALRRRNLIGRDQMPYKTPLDMTYDSGDFVAVLDKTMERADRAGFAARRRESEARGRLRGFGIGAYLELTAPPGKELADIRFEPDGTVTLWTGSKDFGMGHATTFAQILCEKLQVPFDRITVRQDDSDQMVIGGGSGGSKSAIHSGTAILAASEKVIENGKKLAAHVLEAAVEDIEYRGGAFHVAGTDRTIGLIALAQKVKTLATVPEGLPTSLDVALAHDTAPATYPNGCHACEVEIDPETGEVDMLRYTVVDDFGTMLNPLIVEGQVHGGIAQGAGQALMEGAVYDEDGQLLTGSYMDYAMPRADTLSSFAFSTHAVPARTNPLGVKGCGEGGNAGSLPAVMNAVLDALATRGVTHLDTPATPAKIWAALKAAKRA
ncbi:MAG: xanthine dehydrogenase family protein molybdopterin-binding subunit [Alphaproteobacteria bacterium]|nr:xanthine dehydrogenase family protein molybdopterin-binding subunit [Alphaproteobacteria bacterium]